MSNPLSKKQPALFDNSEDSMDGILARCQRLNEWARKIDLQRWHYFSPKAEAVRVIDGIVAAEVWETLDGGSVDYANADPDELAKVNNRARWLIRHGCDMPERLRRWDRRQKWECPEWLARYNRAVAEGQIEAKKPLY